MMTRGCRPVPRRLPCCSRPGRPLPDLTERLVKSGTYNRYVAWRGEYRRWREGQAQGAQGELSEASTAAGAAAEAAGWRDSYRRWRQGAPCGAVGEAAAAKARPVAPLLQRPEQGGGAKLRSMPAIIFDVVVADRAAAPALVPVDGPEVPPFPVDSFPEEALVTIRVFRFFEDRSDEGQVWEQELQNVNSGSLLWLPVHLAPGLHSSQGAKYGSWFTIHYIQVYAKHFRSAYHMATDGSSYPAKTFGSTAANMDTVSGQRLPQGYFWYVSPASSGASLAREGWQHLCRAGPFDGGAFLERWRQGGSSMDAGDLQRVLIHMCEA
mmetsp:Transcript_30186/g.83297  ORF Transcript_30186/g.83297 Transcript_30186/m.83297 type:complete len:323 (-) Transcript_30186:131-1099(-)